MFRFMYLLFIAFFLTACATPSRLGISEAEWQNYTPEQRQDIKKSYYTVLKGQVNAQKGAPSDGSRLQVNISGGKIKLPPFVDSQNYTPIAFTLRSGECKTIQVTDANSDKKIPMKACYLNKTLYLDPSRYEVEKSVGSIQLHYSPIWDRDFTYQGVSSTGYVHLTNVNVSVSRYTSESAE